MVTAVANIADTTMPVQRANTAVVVVDDVPAVFWEAVLAIAAVVNIAVVLVIL
jgi:hypothetical protein